MLFEVFRCEETDTINNIAIAQFLKVVIELVCKNSKLLFHSCKYHLPFHFLPCFFSFQENLHYAQDVYFSTNWFLRRGRSSIWMPFLSLVLSNTGLEIGHFEKKSRWKKLKNQEKKLHNSREKFKVSAIFCKKKVYFSYKRKSITKVAVQKHEFCN